MEDSRHEASFIRGVVIQENEALGLIKCKMIQLEDGVKRKMIRLEEEAKAIEGDLVRFAAAHKHSLLPNEILSRIFVLAAQDYGAVVFPMSKTKIPPQLVVSHVCSHWRTVAFRTSELWSNTSLYPEDNVLPVVHLHERWLRRAEILPVMLSIEFNDSMDMAEIARELEKILSTFCVKILLLDMSYEQFVVLLWPKLRYHVLWKWNLTLRFVMALSLGRRLNRWLRHCTNKCQYFWAGLRRLLFTSSLEFNHHGNAISPNDHPHLPSG